MAPIVYMDLVIEGEQHYSAYGDFYHSESLPKSSGLDLSE